MISRFSKEQSDKPKHIKPTIIPRAQHSISRSAINRNALKVLYRLHGAGYSAYLVGGCVRDLLLGHHPKDFDIATSAHPEEIRKLFKNCRLIGKRFRLAHIVFGREVIEVATFRTHHQNAQEHHAKMHQGMIVRDNVYGNIEDDVWRRDFSINALYYNIADFSVVDYIGGMEDIQTKTLRIIGNAEERFLEDPVRLLRAVRFLAKLKVQISPETEAPIIRLSHLLSQVSSARLFQEVLKLFQEGATASSFELLQKYRLFEQLFTQTAAFLHQPETQKLLQEVLINTDQRIAEGKTVSPAFLLAAFVWYPVAHEAKRGEAKGMPLYVALEQALQNVLKLQSKQLAIPRKLLISIRDICMLQHFLTHRHGSRPYRSLEHPRFRAAYDLLVLRAKAGEPVQELASWWEQFQTGDPERREQLLKEAHKTPRTKKRRNFKRKRPADSKQRSEP